MAGERVKPTGLLITGAETGVPNFVAVISGSSVGGRGARAGADSFAGDLNQLLNKLIFLLTTKNVGIT
jgi:hypothetical protein